jgi:hypothetical protein
MTKIKIFLLLLDYWMDKTIGWFFTNGRKQKKYMERIEWKKILIENERKKS